MAFGGEFQNPHQYLLVIERTLVYVWPAADWKLVTSRAHPVTILALSCGELQAPVRY